MKDFFDGLKGLFGSTTKLIVALIGLIVVLFFFVPPVNSYCCISDPLPKSVRTSFDRMYLRGGQAQRLAAIIKIKGSALPETVTLSQEYQDVASKFNRMIDVAQRAIRLRSFGGDVFEKDLPGIESETETLLQKLHDAKAKVMMQQGADHDLVETGVAFLKDTARGWEKLLASRTTFEALVIKDLEERKWPHWDKIKAGVL